ncbi:MAG TPA: acetate--CoA ligase, partial [Chloroflexota bacterium]|nr:acetate--CoA ligase [Chloroflexota bacterium]
ADLHIRWYADGTLNVAANCLDRHLAERGDKTAIIFEGDDPGESRRLSYRELHAEVCRFANALKHLGIAKGDRVAIYMPMIPEAAVAMLACARIGAVHSVVFGGFSPDSLAGRIADSQCKLVVTADEGARGGKRIALKANVDEALTRADTRSVETVVVVRRTGGSIDMQPPRDRWYHSLVEGQSSDCAPEPMDAEDPLFILYTSGSTGKPKGVLHTSAGYLVYVGYTHECVFDLREDDVYWCTADVGWVTGHSYVVYGPLANGATTVMFDGVPSYPDTSRFWQVVDKHRVTLFYTAPTAIRALMRDGEAPVRKTSRASLRLLGTVGEPINPEAWIWYHKNIGGERCPVVDTWWQTETGMIMITPLPGVVTLKPGSATLPFPGVTAQILDEQGHEVGAGAGGNLVVTRPWPAMARTIFGDDDRYVRQYWSRYEGKYLTGDGARRDSDGYFWLLGRVDDEVHVAGHRIGTMEVESALVSHPSVAEAAVIGISDELKGQALAAFVTPRSGVQTSPELIQALRQQVTKEIGPIARPDKIFFTAELPKTRSAKIMRRLLRDIAEGRVIGDTTTLTDPTVLSEIKRQYEETES